MQKFFLSLLGLLLLVACEQESVSPSVLESKQQSISLIGKQNKITICHYSAEDDSWKLKNISPNAWADHEAHGDVRLDDQDQDGFVPDNECDYGQEGDCDDLNEAINPAASEIPYNGIDDDCNAATPDDDLDGDGFNLVDDCDDTDEAVNPYANEIPYNGKDDDCNETTPDDDLDGDGFNLANECDDTDETVNPGAIEIEDNNIDDDCDGLVDERPSVQERLNGGETPCEIFGSGIPMDSLYGKTYQGGLIFYLNTNTCEGLVAAPMDLDFNGEFRRPWGCDGTDLPIPNTQCCSKPNGPGSQIGDGATNTIGIVNASCSGTGDAATICADLVLNGFDDWFLPSAKELNRMYAFLKRKGLGNLSSDKYWSSTENSSSRAWIQVFINGIQAVNLKNDSNRVRAIRAF